MQKRMCGVSILCKQLAHGLFIQRAKAFVPGEHSVRKRRLFLLQKQDTLLDGVRRNELKHLHALRLADAVRAVGRLREMRNTSASPALKRSTRLMRSSLGVSPLRTKQVMPSPSSLLFKISSMVVNWEKSRIS